jgi:D-glycero-alpha-D-manno-heptose-7-phosphate kinase
MRPDTVQHVKVEAESDITSNFGGSRLLNPNSDNFSRLSIRAKAPLRISFAGGGTDVPPYPEQEGGCVLNATIDSFAWGSLRPRNDANIKLESADLGIRLDFTVDSKMELNGELDLVKAAIKRLNANNSHGFDVFLHCDAPPGSGLGSSSALMVALVGLVKEFKNLPLTPYEIADLAYVIEREDLEIKGGLQDQYAATFGGFNFIEFLKDRVIVNPLRIGNDTMNELEHNLLLCYTGKTRRSDEIIRDQTARFEGREKDTTSALNEQKDLAIEMKNALLRGRLDDFGQLLHTVWESKKRISPRISNSRIDEIYAEARKLGAIGGKITGAGGGGYLMFYCLFDKKHIVADRLRQMDVLPAEFAFERNGMQTWRVHEARPGC